MHVVQLNLCIGKDQWIEFMDGLIFDWIDFDKKNNKFLTIGIFLETKTCGM